MKKKGVLTKAGAAVRRRSWLWDFAPAREETGFPGSGEKEKSSYRVTEENENQELVMDNQPESSYWFPEELLEWEPSEDEDLEYNVSHVPLASGWIRKS